MHIDPTKTRHWVWKAVISGLCGSMAHTALMLFKSQTGLLHSFQPYAALQIALASLTGTEVNPLVPWALSFVNGATIVGLAFGRTYPAIPGRNGAIKGLIFGLFGWLVMGLVFFPLLGLGLFGTETGAGIAPAVFSLAMLLTYSVVMGLVYSALR
jgi:hypothetical protein